MNVLSGYKTYIVSALMVLVGLVNVLTGDVSGWDTISNNGQLLLEGLGIAALRAGVSKGSV